MKNKYKIPWHVRQYVKRELMDYKSNKRLLAEYNQLVIRLEKLKAIINKAKDKSLEFELSCPLAGLEAQAWYMQGYAEILRARAEIEGIDLEIGER